MKTNDREVQQMLQTISYEPYVDEDVNVLTATYSMNPKYHSLLGKNQHAERNANTIKMSSGSAVINIYKNVQNRDIINVISKNEFTKQQELQIQECIRAFNIELRHLQPLKKAFIKCDKNHCGLITVKSLIKRIYKMKMHVPRHILQFYINTLLERQNDT